MTAIPWTDIEVLGYVAACVIFIAPFMVKAIPLGFCAAYVMVMVGYILQIPYFSLTLMVALLVMITAGLISTAAFMKGAHE